MQGCHATCSDVGPAFALDTAPQALILSPDGKKEIT
jgi:hypothetical protein